VKCLYLHAALEKTIEVDLSSKNKNIHVERDWRFLVFKFTTNL